MVHQTHPDIVKRLRRAEGNLRNTIAVIEEERSCVDVAQQLHAMEKAVGQSKKVFIHDHVDNWLEQSVGGRAGGGDQDVIAEFKQISKYL